jgi:RimJ/RimL family protein N-acetyltransferase
MIETERLTLRPWREGDVDEFMRVTNTPAVMEYLGGPRTREEFEAAAQRQQAAQDARGHCFWIVERRADQAMLGMCGLKILGIGPAADDIEIGWRLREDAWGQGYAREAAEASLAWGWANLAVERIIAITVPANVRSWGLMERLGMERRDELGFAHPAFAPDDPLSRHITYVIDRPSMIDASILR